MRNNLTSLDLHLLANDLRASRWDVENDTSTEWKNDAALRMLCVARQIALRFGKGWA